MALVIRVSSDLQRMIEYVNESIALEFNMNRF